MSVYRPKDRKGGREATYHFDFRHGGRRFSGDTGATTKAGALAVERKLKDNARAERHAERTRDYTLIDAAFGRFWIEKGQHDVDADSTFQRQARLRDGLGEILAARGRPATLAALDNDVLAEYVARLRAKPIIRRTKKGKISSRPRSPADVNRDVQLLRRIMRRAKIVWRLSIELPDWKELLSPEPDERVADVPHELEAQLSAEMRADYRPALRWLILSGLRVGNGLPLHPSQVNFETDTVTVRLKSKRPGGRLFVLPLTRAMKLLIAGEIGRHPDGVFTYRSQAARDGRSRGGRYPLLPATFYDELKRAAKVIGLPWLRVHDLRHVAGTRTLRATGNLRAAQHHLAHTRISTTTKYAHFLVDELRAAMEKAHETPAQNATPEPVETAKILPPKAESA